MVCKLQVLTYFMTVGWMDVRKGCGERSDRLDDDSLHYHGSVQFGASVVVERVVSCYNRWSVSYKFSYISMTIGWMGVSKCFGQRYDIINDDSLHYHRFIQFGAGVVAERVVSCLIGWFVNYEFFNISRTIDIMASPQRLWAKGWHHTRWF
jgi:hypothetical protein